MRRCLLLVLRIAIRMRPLEFFVPSNRLSPKGERTHVDGWNEYIKAVNTSRYAGAARERENVHHVAAYAALAMRQADWTPPETHSLVYVTFIERDRRRDIPNVYGGLKWVLDGLSRPRGSKLDGAGAIVDDSQKWLTVVPMVAIDRQNPGVHIKIVPVDNPAEIETVQVMGTNVPISASTNKGFIQL